MFPNKSTSVQQGSASTFFRRSRRRRSQRAPASWRPSLVLAPHRSPPPKPTAPALQVNTPKPVAARHQHPLVCSPWGLPACVTDRTSVGRCRQERVWRCSGSTSDRSSCTDSLHGTRNVPRPPHLLTFPQCMHRRLTLARRLPRAWERCPSARRRQMCHSTRSGRPFWRSTQHDQHQTKALRRGRHAVFSPK